MTVETATLEGRVETAVYERGLARLVHHEIDHLDGLLYTAQTRGRRRTHPCRGVSPDRTGMDLRPVGRLDVNRARPAPEGSCRRTPLIRAAAVGSCGLTSRSAGPVKRSRSGRVRRRRRPGQTATGRWRDFPGPVRSR
ncbi:hypothetical protein [Streptomyces bacillaris]|uniref:hypothetical protein n=1 Tax=Streptomyces bacillaris TaxID=68179 RepID=UPI0032DCC6EC